MIGTSGKRELGNCVLLAQLENDHDDDDYIYK